MGRVGYQDGPHHWSFHVWLWIHWDELWKQEPVKKLQQAKEQQFECESSDMDGEEKKIDWNLLEITTSQLSNLWFLSCAFRWLCGRFRSSLRSRIGIASKTQMSTWWCLILDGLEMWRHSEKNCLCCRLRASDWNIWNILKPKAIRKPNGWPTGNFSHMRYQAAASAATIQNHAISGGAASSYRSSM